ncbi:hypothetical protein [Chryseobacterium sp.]|uniref:hypothetical protein n=1 Tax=Chryseobacterium sp. TaxID=1871047 RepID=UPI00388F5115
MRNKAITLHYQTDKKEFETEKLQPDWSGTPFFGSRAEPKLRLRSASEKRVRAEGGKAAQKKQQKKQTI